MRVPQLFSRCSQTHIYLSPVELLPEINLDAFEVCIYKNWEIGKLIYYGTAMLFGTSSSSRLNAHHSSTFGVLMRLPFDFLLCCDCRRPRILDHCGHGEEIGNVRTPDHTEYLEDYSKRCDTLLHPHIFRPFSVHATFIRRPGT